MRTTSLLLVLALACSGQRAAEPEARPAERRDFDVVVRNGEVIDGSGAPRRRADVGIRGDAIAAIGDLSGRTAHVTIDAQGRVVTPGFIDMLGHSEGPVLIDPHLEGKVRQGVTTEVTGEGHSPGPIDDAMAADQNRTRPPGYPEVTWRSLDDFMRVVQRRGSAINFAFYTGEANPREIVIGSVNRPATPEELRRMEAITEESMRAGAVGLSTALIYVPGVFASTEEIIDLARVAAKYHGSYYTHLRNEADGIDAAIDEAVRIGREAGLPVDIFHLKVGGVANHGRMPEIVARIEAARKSGVDVAANVYPYTATATSLTAIVPAWALEGGGMAFRARLADPAQRSRIAGEIAQSSFYRRIGGAHEILVRRIPAPALKQYERLRLDEIARRMGVGPIEAAIRLFQECDPAPTAIYFSMSEEDVQVALRQPWVAIGSDSGAVVGEAKTEGAHPRAYGTFPRVLGHYVRDVKLFPLEEAVRKMTSFAAGRAHLPDRGLLREGMKADVVVFDPATIRDVSTYEDPHHFSEGIDAVLVNGVPVLQGGKMTEALPGKVLRR